MTSDGSSECFGFFDDDESSSCTTVESPAPISPASLTEERHSQAHASGVLVPMTYPRPLLHARNNGWSPPSLRPSAESPKSELRHAATSASLSKTEELKEIGHALLFKKEKHPEYTDLALDWILSQTTQLLRVIQNFCEHAISERPHNTPRTEPSDWVEPEFVSKLNTDTNVLGRYLVFPPAKVNGEGSPSDPLNLWFLATAPAQRGKISFSFVADQAGDSFKVLATFDIQFCHLFKYFMSPYQRRLEAPEILEGLFLALSCDTFTVHLEERPGLRLLTDFNGFTSALHSVDYWLVGRNEDNRRIWEHCAGYVIR